MTNVPVTDVRIAVMRLARRLRNERPDDVLTPSQMAVLGTLMRNGPQSPGELAASEHVQPPSMTRIIASLQERGLVCRKPHPQDGRQVIVELTETARDQVEADRAHRDQWLQARIEAMDPDDQELLLRAVPILNRLALEPEPSRR